MSVSIEFRELSASAEDLARLRTFYDTLYVGEFPDPDERESRENMERYLALKAQGWYGRNNYHILLAEEDGRPVAGAILDYLAEANAGVLEFLVVAPHRRGVGLGTRVLGQAEQQLEQDAQRAGAGGVDCIAAEINDPFLPASVRDNIDPFDRTAIWAAWGFGVLDFPYVQPALSVAQKPVSCLLLGVKIFRPEYREGVPTPTVDTIVHEYLRWAMRIETPESNTEFQEIRRYLRERRSVPVISLTRYIGRDPAAAVDVHEIREALDPDLEPALAVYRNAFPPGPTAVTSEAIRARLDRGGRARDGAYHLWALRSVPGGAIEGMVSFFTLPGETGQPGTGFGGYIVLAGALRGRGRLRSLIARIEERMLLDGLGARGWYIECERDSLQAAIFQRIGFREPDLTYHQPAIGVREGPLLRLLYKQFGRCYGPPSLTVAELLAALRQIFRIVYGLDGGELEARLDRTGRQIAAWADETVRWQASGPRAAHRTESAGPGPGSGDPGSIPSP